MGCVIKKFIQKIIKFSLPLGIYSLIVLTPMMLYPFTINGNTLDLRTVRCIMVFCSSTIILSLLQKNIWLKLLCIWVVINYWLNFLPLYSFLPIAYLIASLAVYIGVKNLLERNIIKVDIILKIFCVLAIFQLVWLCLQWFGKDPIFLPTDGTNHITSLTPRKGLLVGWCGNPCLLGMFFSITAFLLLNYFKVIGKVSFFLILLACVFLKNFTTILALTIAGIFYTCLTFDKNKRNKILTALFVLAGLFTIYSKFPNFGRIPIWIDTLHTIKHYRPFVGLSMGSFKLVGIVNIQNEYFSEAHNDYLQIWLELGTIGIMLFGLFIISKIVEFFKEKRNKQQICIATCLIAFLVSMFSLFPMHVAQLSFITIVLLATLERTYS